MPLELGDEMIDEDDTAVDPDSVQTLKLTLKSARAKHAFLEECRHLMKGKPPFKASNAALEIIAERLYDLHRISVTVAACRKLWRQITGNYLDRKKKEAYDWSFYDIIAELKGDLPRPAGWAKVSQKAEVTVKSAKYLCSPINSKKRSTASSLSPPSKKTNKAQNLASCSKGNVLMRKTCVL